MSFASLREQAQRSLPLLPGWLAVAGLLLASGMLLESYPPMGWSLLGIAGVGALGLSLGSPWLCCQLMCLGLFTGILTALPVGFTLKAPQLFSLLGLMAIGLGCLRRRVLPDFPWSWAWPFLLFLLSLLPSFLMVDRAALGLGEAETSLRLLLNYGLLQLFTLFLLLQADSLQRVTRLLKLAWISCLASLLFGFGQQLGFYLGRYDPFAYVGSHSSIVDFYGPFLRLSPGTFANEYGEILQSVGILLAGWLLLIRPSRGRWLWSLLLVGVIVGLVMNFTRASWLVFAVGVFALLLAARLRPGALIGSALLGGLALALLLYLSQVLLEASVLLSVGQRFGELGQVTSHSAGQRLVTWQTAWQAFLASPWIGNGWGQFGETHNVPLQLLAETGLLGFCGFYALMLWCARTMYRGWRAATDPQLRSLLLVVAIACAGCLAFDLTNHGLYHFVLWFCLGLGLALAKISLKQVTGNS
ncbi:MAG: O-antigen ligase family protein [Candidatus Sericytochromatia bacterium]